MELSTITMEKEAAEEALKEYRAAVTSSSHEKMNEARRDYEKMDRAIMRGYREIAKGNRLIRLSETVISGGVQEISWERENWTRERGSWTETRTGTFPRIAVTRADARLVVCRGITSDGSVSFLANDPWTRRKSDRVEIGGFQRPQKFESQNHKAIVPTIPPLLRPPHNLSNYHILWEANWEIDMRTPPGDPALLKQLEGDLYVVLAVWDLTDLERAVLAGMRSEA